MPSQPTISPDTKGSPKSSDDASTQPGVLSGGSPAPPVSPPSHTVTPSKPPPSTPPPGPTATADSNVHQPTSPSTQGAASWNSAGGGQNTYSRSGSSTSQPPNTSAQGVPPRGTTNPTQHVQPSSIRPAYMSTPHSTLTESPTKPTQSSSSPSVVTSSSSDARSLTTTTHKNWFPTSPWVQSTKPNSSSDASPTKNANSGGGHSPNLGFGFGGGHHAPTNLGSPLISLPWTATKPLYCWLLTDCATSSQSSTARGHISSTPPNPSERSRPHDSQTTETSTVRTGKPMGTSHGIRPHTVPSPGPGPKALTTVLDTTTIVSSTTSSSTTSNNNHPTTSKSSQTHHPPTTSSSPSRVKPSPTSQSPTPKNSSPHRAPSPQVTTLSTVEPTSPSPVTSQPTTTSSEHTRTGPEVTQPGTASQPTSTGDSLITPSSRASESTNTPGDSSTSSVQASSTPSSHFDTQPPLLLDGPNLTASTTPQGSTSTSTIPLTSSAPSSSKSSSASRATSSFTNSGTSPLGTAASHSKGNAALIGGIVGAIVGFILLCITIYFIFRRKKRQNLHDQEASAPLSPARDGELVTQFTPYNQLLEPTTGVGYNVFYPDASNSYVSIHQSNDQEMDTVLSSSNSSFEPETPLPPSPFYPNDSTETIQAVPGLDSPSASILHEENNDAIDYEADGSSGVPYITSNPISVYPSVMATASSSAFYSARQTESTPETFYATPRESMDSLSTLQPDTRVVEPNPSTISLVGFQAFDPEPMPSSSRNPFVVSGANESQVDESRLHVKTESEQERDWTASLSAPSPSPSSSEGPSIASGSKNPYYNYLKALKTQGTSGQPPSSWGMRNVFPATSRLSTASSALEVPDSESQCGIAI
ncbi:hypothetical protein SERLA73DRAFT_68977 [Serpula lacrymans var. lacrymans S7.3]|uniref:Uncharacterized protein n=1 Tax=Serpula lacrymans var. lacrymans (strain S7.3) TaxID=936435 RepID=F8PG26_SERL3|nr:hypothetical protein SERLA73DRAFT_68977 [Serpula lacrymans var. lacrymans S7.3]